MGRSKRFSPDGVLEGDIVVVDGIMSCTHIAVHEDSATDRLYVLDTDHDRVRAYSPVQ